MSERNLSDLQDNISKISHIDYDERSTFNFTKFELSEDEFEAFQPVRIKDKVQIIFSGTFCEIFLAKNTNDDLIYAIKKVNKQKLIETNLKIEQLYQDINIHLSLNHENIIKIHFIHENNENVFIILDYATQGSLSKKLQQKACFSEEEVFNYFFQICKAVEYMHEKSIIHRDIKSENILLGEDGRVYLCDFGWAKDISVNRDTFSGIEINLCNDQNDKNKNYQCIDNWSLGTLLYELLHGFLPYKRKNRNSFENEYDEICNKIKNEELLFKQNLANEVKEFIKNILNYDPNKSLNVKEMICDPVMKKYLKNKNEKKIDVKKSINSFTKPSISKDYFQNFRYDAKKSMGFSLKAYNKSMKEENLFSHVLEKMKEKSPKIIKCSDTKFNPNDKLNQVEIIENEQLELNPVIENFRSIISEKNTRNHKYTLSKLKSSDNNNSNKKILTYQRQREAGSLDFNDDTNSIMSDYKKIKVITPKNDIEASRNFNNLKINQMGRVAFGILDKIEENEKVLKEDEGFLDKIGRLFSFSKCGIIKNNK